MRFRVTGAHVSLRARGRGAAFLLLGLGSKKVWYERRDAGALREVAPDVASLMNPSGDATGLDRVNARVVRETRVRTFQGDLERDVLDRIDLEATTLAYEDAMRAKHRHAPGRPR